MAVWKKEMNGKGQSCFNEVRTHQSETEMLQLSQHDLERNDSQNSQNQERSLKKTTPEH